jgi:hypothetical protein
MDSDWVTNFGKEPLNVKQNEIPKLGNIRRIMSGAGKG